MPIYIIIIYFILHHMLTVENMFRQANHVWSYIESIQFKYLVTLYNTHKSHEDK